MRSVLEIDFSDMELSITLEESQMASLKHQMT